MRGHPIDVPPLFGTQKCIADHMWDRAIVCPMLNGVGTRITQGAGRKVLLRYSIIGIGNLPNKRSQGARGCRHL